MIATIRSWFPYVALAAVLVGTGVWIWSGVGMFAAPEPEGISVVCSHPACGHHFMIPREQSRTYPRGPNGEGFKCGSCGRFSAQIALRCATCSHWYLPVTGQGRGETACPRCQPTPAK